MTRPWLPTLAAVSAVGGLGAGAAERELRVCADPNNLPFSNEQEEGFENRIAELVADELNAELSYSWWAQRRGFIRNTLGAGACDLVIGVPAGYDLVETTDPYYRSAYVYVYRRARPRSSLHARSPAPGSEDRGAPGRRQRRQPAAAHALGQLGIVDNVVGYMIYGDYEEPNPPARIVEAVARGELDVAAVWGPDRRVLRQAGGGSARGGADHGHRGLRPSALRVRHRHGRAKASMPSGTS